MSGSKMATSILAKVYLLAGNKIAAISTYQLSIIKNNDPEQNEAFAELKKLDKG